MRPERGRVPVAIDGFNLALEEGTGVATYGRELAHSLGALGCDVSLLYGRHARATDDPLLREVEFYDPPKPRSALRRDLRRGWQVARAVGRGVTAQEVGGGGRVIAESFGHRVPAHDRLYNSEALFTVAEEYHAFLGARLTVHLPQTPRVMHWTYPLPIRVAGAKNVYTIHDLVPLRLPQTTLDRKGRYLKLMRRLAAEADHIVTVSEASRRDIQELLGVPDERVTNTYQTVRIPQSVAALTEAELTRELASVFGLTRGGYYLFFGAIEPKKNVGRLIQAYLASGLTTPLLIVGKRAWKSKEELRVLDLEALRSELNPGDGGRRVIRLDYAPYDLLLRLAKGARAVLFPSLYEGFGLPVLEAMALGTPVVTSATSSLPEVAGDAALLVDPYDVSAIRDAILAVDAKADLRARLSKAGLQQAQRFSPAAYQDRLTALYERLGVWRG